MTKIEGSAKLLKKEGDTSINVSLGKKTMIDKIKEHHEKLEMKIMATCVNCGKFINKPIAVCSRKSHWFTGQSHRERTPHQSVLCKDCAKKCQKCGKYYCPKHLKKHECI